LVVIWFVMAIAVAIVASSKGKDGLAWFLYGLVLWPVALVHILVTPMDIVTEEMRLLQSGRRKCPECAELIKVEAKICHFCGNKELPPAKRLVRKRTLYDEWVWDRTMD
jgi:hypothetical protein